MKNRLSAYLCQLCLLLAASGAPVDSLESSFQHPPASARPWVYWFPLSGNLTRAGITADLEAMARVGIGGVLYMEVDQGAPLGAADFAGPLWMDMFSHACREAKRLGLEINFNNDAGWNGSGGPWIRPEMSMQKVVWSEMLATDSNRPPLALPQPLTTNAFYQDIAVLAMPEPKVESLVSSFVIKASSQPAGIIKDIPSLAADFKEAPAGSVIARDQVIDLTARMDREGHLNWAPPSGQWLVMRFGHTTTDKENKPAPASGRGLECDKLSAAATAFHFNQLMGKLVEQNRALTGQGMTLVGVHIDSWENGTQNWTPLMRKEFRRRRGYDLLPFLPALSGRIVGSTEITERFFHMNAISSAVGLKVDFDMALLVLASGLYRLVAQRMRGCGDAQARQIFRDLINMPADAEIGEKEVSVSFHRRAHLPIILASDLVEKPVAVPWWNGVPLRLTTYNGPKT